MAIYTYDQFRKVLKILGFECIRSKKHETWHKLAEDGTVHYVRISHKGGKGIPKWLFAKMIKQTGITQEEFKEILEGKRK
ncbi:hypothetical protein DRQ15_09180 [candidate division KSB1 bacterium]|nr:MAG: hypothetical protein DRQ15_09180 [candidate division KSB1 bacterium]